MANLSDRTRAEQVYDRLAASLGEWVPGMEIMNAQCGGSRGGGRIYELRKEGFSIDTRPDPDPMVSPSQYRLNQMEPLPGAYVPDPHRSRVEPRAEAKDMSVRHLTFEPGVSEVETERRNQQFQRHHAQVAESAPLLAQLAEPASAIDHMKPVDYLCSKCGRVVLDLDLSYGRNFARGRCPVHKRVDAVRKGTAWG